MWVEVKGNSLRVEHDFMLFAVVPLSSMLLFSDLAGDTREFRFRPFPPQRRRRPYNMAPYKAFSSLSLRSIWGKGMNSRSSITRHSMTNVPDSPQSLGRSRKNATDRQPDWDRREAGSRRRKWQKSKRAERERESVAINHTGRKASGFLPPTHISIVNSRAKIALSPVPATSTSIQLAQWKSIPSRAVLRPIA